MTERSGFLSRDRGQRAAVLGAVALLWLCAASSARAQAPKGVPKSVTEKISFQARVTSADPFHPLNTAGPAKAPQVRRGETFRLTITGKIYKEKDPTLYTYSLTRSTGQSGGPKLIYATPPGLVPLWPVQETESEGGVDELGAFVWKHKGTFQWSQDVLVLPSAEPGQHTLEITIDSQVCDKKTCDRFKYPLQVAVEVVKEPEFALTPELKKRQEEKVPAYARVKTAEPTKVAENPPPASKGVADGVKGGSERPSGMPEGGFIAPDHQASMAALKTQIPAAKMAKADGATEGSDLLAFILAGVFWGGVSLITPCVFPMIPITVSFFLKQSEKDHHRPVTMAVVYCSTIVIVLTVAAVALLSFFRVLSINPWMNFALGALFIFFALSLFGMYEIELPSGLARFTSEREGKGGLIGTIFMALTFTIISFACVAPFLGGFGGTAGTTQRPLWHSILGGLAFSITFAAPFFFLALFPTLLKKMPKSGSWLNSVKVVMGFLELAAALKFFRAGELISTAAPTIFTYDFVMALYVVLSVLCGMYLLNLYRLPHDSPAEHLGVPRLMFALLFLGLALYLTPALFMHSATGERQRPGGMIYAWIDSFLLPDAHGGGEGQWTGNLEYAVTKAREHLRKTGQPKRVFVDFTGVTCTNCKINERDVFSKPAIRKLFEPYELVQLYTDKVPNELYSPADRARFGTSIARQEEDAAVNLEFQRKVFDTEQLPLYVILEPKLDGTIQVVNVYDEGRINDEGAFAQFLRSPQQAGGGNFAQAKVN
ncbi:MAG: hypothetical protein IT429_22750 [Gemmataceae bacterium]|nr:hypothetical protein [Gemmataceae bacterium]